MLHHSDPSQAEVSGFSQAQLEALTHSVEQRRQQLEKDIQDYIARKQDELRHYEQQLIEQNRSMECDAGSGSRLKPSPSDNEGAGAVASSAIADQTAPLSPDTAEPEHEDKSRHRKHTRVHKREKELYGLITPVFLPLLDARDTSSTQQKAKKQFKEKKSSDASTTDSERSAAARDAERIKENRKSKKENKDMEGTGVGDSTKETQQTDTLKKKRSTIRKSSLKHIGTPRTRRKRVSLVIDGQTVLPADTVQEPSLTSPSSEATSASNSTTSLDEMIDPRLARFDAPTFIEHHDAVHHSLPVSMSNNVNANTKPLADTPPSITLLETSNSPPDITSPRSPSIPVGSFQTATRTFLDPSPVHPNSIPDDSGPDPIFPPSASPGFDDEELIDEPQWDTYVGGLHGSGVDDVDQAGSYGYPSSLGASYMETYMQRRPLSVRMQAADKAELNEREKRQMIMGNRDEQEKEKDKDVSMDQDTDMNFDDQKGKDRKDVDPDHDDEMMGAMDDF